MCADDGAIDDRADFVDFQLELFEDHLPVTLLRPVVEPVVDGLPRAESLGKISPRHACLRSEEDSLDEEPVAQRGRWTRLLLRQNSLQATPLIVGECMSTHAEL